MSISPKSGARERPPGALVRVLPGVPPMGDDRGMVNISAAYTGRWASQYRDLAIRYNEKVWNLAESVDT
ncbi:MAG: hypothetical protein B0D84_06155, partial [Candidatus Sedimenticola endophacoides]